MFSNDTEIFKANMDAWLQGVRPAWVNLTHEEIRRLNAPYGSDESPLRIAKDLPQETLHGSLILQHALLVLRRIAASDGVKLTPKGNLNRKFVAEMLDAFSWERYNKERILSVCKVVNEEDLFPLHLIHILLKLTKLVRKYKGSLRISSSGKQILQAEAHGLLQGLLFETLISQFNLAYLDRAELEHFIQPQIQQILLLIGRSADGWITPIRLMRQTVMPIPELFDMRHDLSDYMFAAQVTQPLVWFGVLEQRQMGANDDAFGRNTEIRKMPLFEQMIDFMAFRKAL
ncbi:hypothetical protein [Magnetofaba australis]|uniref:Uncharacterized protein n=1 Tax=Magnetofaba australis IT-1 TaxID=1434232 RepID=A0A1Y2KAB5_9PROT|nr:hypothetical protein [Magnetofaba australis]OSM08771.1 hypothetical protein MAIT1_02855 [Magnetofaba australis IT-1]